MGLVFSETSSGLVAAHMGADEVSVRAALKDHDRDLNLEWKRVNGQHIWYVTKYSGSERRDDWICDWVADGQPLPLSHGLVQRVKDLDMNSRWVEPDAEEENDRMVAALRAESDAEIEELSKEVVDRYRGKTNHLLPRGVYRRNTRFRDVRS